MLKLEAENRVPDLESFWISAELALPGELRPVKGALSIALEARRRNRQTLICHFRTPRRLRGVKGVDDSGRDSRP
jgi:magnesium chelatase family protein